MLNDSFGALVVALSYFKPLAISDSWLSQRSTQLNFSANKLLLKSVSLKNLLDWPTHSMDVVLIKVPKTLALLEDQLFRLQALLTPKSTVIAAGMVKLCLEIDGTLSRIYNTFLGKEKSTFNFYHFIE